VPRTGRRPGPGRTRAKILASARTQFANVGFEAATVRAIAAEARVDPALILHYFESKDALFRTAVAFPLNPAEFVPRLLAPGVNGLGDRLVHFFIETWDSPAGRPLLALIRSVVANAEAAALLREFVRREVLGRLATALEIDQPELRTSLAASTLIGAAMMRYVVELEPIAKASPEELAAWLGPTIQRYLTAPDFKPVTRTKRGGAGTAPPRRKPRARPSASRQPARTIPARPESPRRRGR